MAERAMAQIPPRDPATALAELPEPVRAAV
jgi:hypothetical protein